MVLRTARIRGGKGAVAPVVTRQVDMVGGGFTFIRGWEGEKEGRDAAMRMLLVLGSIRSCRLVLVRGEALLGLLHPGNAIERKMCTGKGSALLHGGYGGEISLCGCLAFGHLMQTLQKGKGVSTFTVSISHLNHI